MSNFLEVWRNKSLFGRIMFVLLVIVNVLFLFYWVALALNYSLHFDDAHFMWKMQEYSIFEYVREMYMTRGGNFAGYGMNGIIFTIANWLGCYQFWPIIFYIIGILMVVGSVRGLFSGLRQLELYLGVIALYNVYVLTSIDVAVFLWLCAMGYYLAGPAICLLIRYINTQRLQWWQWLIYILLVVLLSGQTVALTPMALLIMFCNGLYIWRNNQWKIASTWNNRIIRRLVFTAIIMLGLYGIMIAAPGNYLRMQGEFDINQPANLMEFFKACAVCIIMFFYFMAFYLPYQLLAVGLGGYIGSKHSLPFKIESPKKGLIIVFCAFALYLVVAVMPLAYLSNGFQIQRNYTHISFFYMMMLFAVGYVMGQKFSKVQHWTILSAICVAFLCVIMCLNIHQDLPIAKAYHKAHQEREAYLLEKQTAGNTDTLYVAKYPSTHAPDAKYVILSILGKKSEPQAIYYEADTSTDPNEYESHIRHLLKLNFDFVLEK